MTSPDKPDTADVPAETTREERSVATASPAGESERPRGPKPSNGSVKPPARSGGTAAQAAKPAGESKPEPADGTQTTALPKASLRTDGTKTTSIGKPAATAPEPKPEPAKPARPAAEPESARTVVTKPVDSADVTSSSPPPWQRVTTDEQYAVERAVDHKADQAAEPELPGDGSRSDSEKTTRFSDWGYQRSPRSDAYSDSAAGADALGGVVSGTAAPSVFAAAAGTSGVHADARPSADPTGRTTVNFNAPPGGSARPAMAPPAAAPSALRRPGRGPRRASLQVRRVDPWSVLKLAFVLSVALFFVWLVAVGVLYGVLDGMGVWDRVNGTYNEFAQNNAAGSSGPLITASRVFGIAAIIGAINIVLFTALATVGSFVYNVSADLAGGLEITLAERE